MKKIALVCSEFNKSLVESLHKESSEELSSYFKDIQLETFWVPGSGEIPLATKWLLDTKKYEGLLALGVVIRGETTHYDSLCKILERSLWDLQKEYSWPIVFSIFTVENREQVVSRIQAGRGKKNTRALIQMIKLKEKFK